jgi:hypothetical protein
VRTLSTRGRHVVRNIGDPATVARRDERIDFWRGLCLVGMVSWHLLTHPSFPRALAFAVIQPFNFVAEGFVLLAGAAVGLKIVQQRYAPSPLLRRVGVLLTTHYALVSFVVLLAVVESKLGLTVQANAVAASVWNVINFSYQPYLADVLSVFVFLFAATPVFQLVYDRLGPRWLAGVSVAVFLTSSMFVVNAGGAFDFNTWQLVFVAGILFGVNYRAQMASWKNNSTRWIVIAAVVFAAAFVVRVFIAGPDGSHLSGWRAYLTFSRKPLTVARLVYIGSEMMVIGLLTVRWWEQISTFSIVARIVMLGRSSLVVFTCSVVLDYVLKAVCTNLRLSFPMNIAVWMFELAVLFAVADVLNGRALQKRNRAAATASQFAIN